MSSSRSESVHADGWGAADETLRLIAKLPAPNGLVDRVQASLHAAPRKGRLLGWPVAIMPRNGWAQTTAFRGVAAAAIVCIVAGGGWGIYSRVPVAPTAHVIVMPARVGGGFSTAGAVRTPDAPVMTHVLSAAPIAQSGKPVQAIIENAAHGAKHARHTKPLAVAAQ